MKKFILLIVMLEMTALFLTGCGQSPEKAALKKLYKPQPGTDVTSSPYYNFSPFTNTVWKTKVKVPLADVEQYTGRHAPTLVAPKLFDPTNAPDNMRLIAWLPSGSRLRIGRLMKDNGAWGGVRVTVILEDGREVNINEMLLVDNKFLSNDWRCTSTNWSVNPDMLEK